MGGCFPYVPHFATEIRQSIQEKKNMEEKMEREKKRLEEIAKKNMEKELKEKEKQKAFYF